MVSAGEHLKEDDGDSKGILRLSQSRPLWVPGGANVYTSSYDIHTPNCPCDCRSMAGGFACIPTF
jgi:hypothetical protein